MYKAQNECLQISECQEKGCMYFQNPNESIFKCLKQIHRDKKIYFAVRSYIETKHINIGWA